MQLVSDVHSRPMETPQWSDIEMAIRSLDGNQYTEVGLYENEECYLQIGGSGNCLVCSVRQGDDLFMLVDPDKSATSMKWVVAGQGSNYPENMCFDVEKVLHVARVFFESRSRSAEFQWKMY